MSAPDCCIVCMCQEKARDAPRDFNRNDISAAASLTVLEAFRRFREGFIFEQLCPHHGERLRQSLARDEVRH